MLGLWREKDLPMVAMLPIQENSLKTRRDLELALIQFCHPLQGHFSPGNAHIDLGEGGSRHVKHVATLEAFSRPLWGIVPAWHTPIDDLILSGIRSGTNRVTPNFGEQQVPETNGSSKWR